MRRLARRVERHVVVDFVIGRHHRAGLKRMGRAAMLEKSILENMRRVCKYHVNVTKRLGEGGANIVL